MRVNYHRSTDGVGISMSGGLEGGGEEVETWGALCETSGAVSSRVKLIGQSASSEGLNGIESWML